MFSRDALSNKKGYSLIEVLIGVSLISVVFLGTTAVYVSSKKMVAQMQNGSPEMDLLLASEHFARKVALGNSVSVTISSPPTGATFPSGAGNQAVIRWDYDLNQDPLMTPGDTTDDTYLKYGIIEDRFRFKIESSESGFVSNTDPEVILGLRVSSAFFKKSATISNRVFFTITSPSGEATTKTSQTEVLLHGSVSQ